MGPVRILLLLTDGTVSTAARIRARLVNAEVYEVRTESALRAALNAGTYHAICIQHPLPWLPLSVLVRVLRAKQSQCPIIMLSHTDLAYALTQLADIPQIELQRTA